VLACIRAVSDLMIPEEDLHVVGRENLCSLLDFLYIHLHEALEDMNRC